MANVKKFLFVLLIFQSQLHCSSFFNFLKKSPETLNSEFFNGKIKLTDLFQKALDKIPNDQEKEAIIVKMNGYFKKCTKREKELFIEIVNQAIPKGILTSIHFQKGLERTVNESINLYEIYKKDNWLLPLDKSSSVKIVKQSDFNLLKSNLLILFKSALSGNEQSLQKIKDMVAQNEASKLSNQEKRDILKLLQDETEKYLHYVNDTALAKNENALKLNIDNDEMPLKLQAISHAQTANSRAVFKYSKDIFRELEPMCSDSQRLIYSIDRENINPLINMVDMKELRLNKVKSLADLPNALEEEANRLKSEGKLQIPLHRESRPIFISELHDKVLGYNQDYVEDQADKTYKKFQEADDKEKSIIIKEHHSSRPDYEPGFIKEQINQRLSEKIVNRSQSLVRSHVENK